MPSAEEIAGARWEAIVQNAWKGELYLIKFKGDPVVYEGIPLARPGMTAGAADDDDRRIFEFDIVRPTLSRGLGRAAVSDIEFMEPRR